MNNSQKVKDWRKRTKVRMVEAFGGICSHCGLKSYPELYDFHHLNPKEKEFGLSSVRANAISWERIVVELRKCIMFCSNCHRLFECGKISLPEKPIRFNEEFADYQRLIREKREAKNACPVCGNLKLITKKTCSIKCGNISHRKVTNRPTQKELEILTKKYPMTAVGKMYGVSDNAVRKWRVQ